MFDDDSDDDFDEKSLRKRDEQIAKAKDKLAAVELKKKGSEATSTYWSRTSSKANEKEQTCQLCLKDLSHMGETAKLQHANECLNRQESLDDLVKKTAEWESIVDCPICFKPMGVGPNKIVHLKKCGDEKGFTPVQLMKMLKTREEQTAQQKKRGFAHTFAPKPTEESVAKKPKRNELLPKSVIDEDIQTAMALSLSEKKSSETDEQPTTSKCVATSHQIVSGDAANDIVSERLAEMLAASESGPKRPVPSRPSSVSSIGQPLKFFPLASLTNDINVEPPENFMTVMVTEEPLEMTVATEVELAQWMTLVEDLKKFRLSGRNGGDVMLNCADGFLFAHSIFLEIRSPGLYKLLQESNDPQKIPTINLNDWPKSVIESLLAHIYWAEVPLTDDLAKPLLQLAIKLDMGRLELLCEAMITKSIKTEPIEQVEIPDNPEQEEINEEIEDISDEQPSGNVLTEETTSDPVENHPEQVEEINISDESSGSVVVTEETTSGRVEDMMKLVKDCCIVLKRSGEISGRTSSLGSPVQIATPHTSPVVKRKSIGFRAEEKEQLGRKLDLVRDSLSKVMSKTPLVASVSFDESSTRVTRSQTSHPVSPRRRSGMITRQLSLSPRKTIPTPAYVDLSDDDIDDSMLAKVPLDNLSAFFNNEESTSTGGYTSTPQIESRSTRRRTKTTSGGAAQVKLGWTRNGNGGVKVVKTADLTPMPNFSLMATPELTAALNENGVRKLPKRQAKKVLKQIHVETHPIIDIADTQDDDYSSSSSDDEDFVPVKPVVKPSAKPGPKRKKMVDSGSELSDGNNSKDEDFVPVVKPTVKPSTKTEQIVIKPTVKPTAKPAPKRKKMVDSSSESSDDNNSSDEDDKDSVLEESVMLTDVESTDTETKQSRPQLNVLVSQVKKFIQGDKILMKKVLSYDPLPLKCLHAAVKASGILCSCANLMTVLDELGVPFTSKDLRKKRGEKKVNNKKKPMKHKGEWNRLLSSKQIFKK